jgi:hypothetical protein
MIERISSFLTEMTLWLASLRVDFRRSESDGYLWNRSYAASAWGGVSSGTFLGMCFWMSP